MSSGAKRVLVTRAAGQGSELAERLRALGMEPVLVPAIETVAPTSFAALDDALTTLHRFDWLLFTSANAVEALAARAGNGPLAFAGKVAAIGPSTAQALGRLQLVADLVPPQAVAEAFTAALLPHARRADGTPARFLLVRAEDARELLPTKLRAAGAEVTVAPAYRTVIPPGSVQLMRDIFACNARSAAAEAPPRIDVITFTSSSTARNLLALCEAAGVTLPGSARRVSIGPITSQTLRDLGLPPHAEAHEATIVALAEAVRHVLVGST